MPARTMMMGTAWRAVNQIWLSITRRITRRPPGESATREPRVWMKKRGRGPGRGSRRATPRPSAAIGAITAANRSASHLPQGFLGLRVLGELGQRLAEQLLGLCRI